MSEDEGEGEGEAVDLDTLNRRHISAVDKFYRMFAGASSRVTRVGGGSFDLRVELSSRVPEDERDGLVRKITMSWRHNRVLKRCERVRVQVFLSPSAQGFHLAVNPSANDPKAELAQAAKEQIARMGKAEGQPKQLFAEYVAAFPNPES